MFFLLPKNSRGGMPLSHIRSSDSPRQIELRNMHTSSTGTLPAVSLTNRAENEKIKHARNEHERPESQISRGIANRRCCALLLLLLLTAAAAVAGGLFACMLLLVCWWFGILRDHIIIKVVGVCG